jgi:hypothetical protein
MVTHIKPDRPKIKRLKLEDYWGLLPDYATSHWVATHAGITHNSVMYYLKGYKDDVKAGKPVRQPSHATVIALRNFFAQYGAPKDDIVEWDVPPIPISEIDRGLSQQAATPINS